MSTLLVGWHKAEIYYHQTNEKSVSDESNPIANSHTNKTNVLCLSFSEGEQTHPAQIDSIRFGPISTHSAASCIHIHFAFFFYRLTFSVFRSFAFAISHHTHTHTHVHSTLSLRLSVVFVCLYRIVPYSDFAFLTCMYSFSFVPLKAWFDTFKCMLLLIFFAASSKE